MPKRALLKITAKKAPSKPKARKKLTEQVVIEAMKKVFKGRPNSN